MTTNVGTAGYAIPLALDATLAAITNDGTASPWRAKATIKTAVSSPYRALTSAGITAAWTAEGVAFGDNSPTRGRVDVPLFKLTAFVNASFEIL
jgi:HK97 family phage major capsid protein